MEKSNFDLESAHFEPSESTERRPLTKKDTYLQNLLFRNEMDRVASLKSFVSSALEESGIDGTTAVYFNEPNGFRVELLKGSIQSSMNNKNFLPSDKSHDLDDYKKIADILQLTEDINVEKVNEDGVFGTVPFFSKDAYVSSSLGVNPEDGRIKKEQVLNYFNGNDIQQEDKKKIANLKESIYSLFRKAR